MLPLPEWQALEAHYQQIKQQHMRDWFAQDPQRFERFSLRLGGLLWDYSKNRITSATISLLAKLANACELAAKIAALFAAEPINSSEARPALHMLLREGLDQPPSPATQALQPLVKQALQKMAVFVDAVHKGQRCGVTGKAFRDVVNIGMGGSHLGPQMVTHAFAQENIGSLRFHFIADIDQDALDEVLTQLAPESTLFIVSSKSFATLETLVNAQQCYAWLQAKLQHLSLDAEKILNSHFIAVTAQAEKAQVFGLQTENIFPLWEWVGGRYSIWSAIGLPLALQLGMGGFQAFLRGAYLADQHFQQAPFSQNMPVLMGLLGIWYHNFFGAATHALIPYDYRLKYLRAYLQQLDMESNGKRMTHAGQEVAYSTGPIVWGELGIHGQHAFYQLLHQGTHVVPVDFFVVGKKKFNAQDSSSSQQDLLVANALCQARALMHGHAVSGAAQHQMTPGNRPSNVWFFESLTPENLGILLALYEHKVFVQSVIWDVNPFDQWGVELGKTMLSSVLDNIRDDNIIHTQDASTENLILHYKKLKMQE